jgi:hypothetical protein
MKEKDRIRILRDIEECKIKKGDTGIIKKVGVGFVTLIVNGTMITIGKVMFGMFEMIEEEVKHKTEVKNWSDLYGLKNDKPGTTIFSYKGVNIDFDKYSMESLEKAVKVINSLGGNYEFIKKEVIDTLEDWEKFQSEICETGLIYNRTYKKFTAIVEENYRVKEIEIITIDDIEKKYNVELKILK